jgi:hypothetical protein
MDATEDFVDARLVELECEGLVLIERIGVERAGLVHHRGGSASRFFHVTVEPALMVIDIGENMKFLMSTALLPCACATGPAAASVAMSIPARKEMEKARRRVIIGMIGS